LLARWLFGTAFYLGLVNPTQAQDTAHDVSAAVRYADYPSGPPFQGKPAQLQLIRAIPQSQTAEAVAQANSGPNFASRYTVLSLMCGSFCMTHFIVDATTGHVLTTAFTSLSGVQYRLDSRLLMIDPPDVDEQGHVTRHEDLVPAFLIWQEDHFDTLSVQLPAN
jgi:hypothetical protein